MVTEELSYHGYHRQYSSVPAIIYPTWSEAMEESEAELQEGERGVGPLVGGLPGKPPKKREVEPVRVGDLGL